MEIQELAREACAWFEVARRTSGGEYVRVKDGAPEWVTELAHHAHGDRFLPDDWRYETIAGALEAIGDAGDVDDEAAEFADDRVDVYTSNRYAWLSSHLSRGGYVDEARDEFGPYESVVDEIGGGQYLEAGEVYGLVLDFLRSRLEELELEEEPELEEAGG